MEVRREQAEKLKRYFVNADPFMWGLLENKNKKARLQELKRLGFLGGYSETANPAYAKVNQDLLVELGIEGIINRIVIPKVTDKFEPEMLGYFRRCWEQGQTPEMKYLKEHQLYKRRILSEDQVILWGEKGESPKVAHKDPAHIFLQIHTQYHFVERWTVFAGLWFEEIEPFFVTARQQTTEG